jgi:hypothetical protein
MFAGSRSVSCSSTRRLRRASIAPRDLVALTLIRVFFLIPPSYHVFAVLFESRLPWPLLGGMGGWRLQLKRKNSAAGPGSVFVYGGTEERSSYG